MLPKPKDGGRRSSLALMTPHALRLGPNPDHYSSLGGRFGQVPDLLNPGAHFGKALFVVLENGQSPKTKHDQIAPFSALFLQTLLDSEPLSAKEKPPLDTPIHQNESVKRQTEAK